MAKQREVCPTCQGEKQIICCSIDDNTQCETIDCPTCGGTGYVGEEKNSYRTIGIIAGVLGVAVGLCLALFM